jgi:arylsulfatase A-like enzyme
VRASRVDGCGHRIDGRSQANAVVTDSQNVDQKEGIHALIGSIRTKACVTLVVIVACTSPGSDAPRDEDGSGEPSSARPNVLVILTDDQRGSGTLRVMPSTRKWFGNEGKRFTQAFVTTPMCCPSRASIFTGQYAHNHDVVRNGQEQVANLQHASTLQRYLDEEGYRTAIFGKFLNGWPLERKPPYFDDWAVFPAGKEYPHELGYYGAEWSINGDITTPKTYSTTFISRRARRFLDSAETDDSTPWLLYMSVYAPHSPSEPEPSYVHAPVPDWPDAPAVAEGGVRDKPGYVRTEDPLSMRELRDLRRNQLRTLMSADDLVQDVFERLVDLDEDRSTLAFFLGDNGYLWGEHGLTGKGVPYTESIHVPFLVRWPGHLSPGARDDRLVSNIDLAPTVLDATRIEPKPRYPMDGRSLLDDPSPRDRLLIELASNDETVIGRSWATIRTPRFQYTEYYDSTGTTLRSQEYYDLATDPRQLHNLLGDRDPSNDPDVANVSLQLSEDRRCRGPSCP